MLGCCGPERGLTLIRRPNLDDLLHFMRGGAIKWQLSDMRNIQNHVKYHTPMYSVNQHSGVRWWQGCEISRGLIRGFFTNLVFYAHNAPPSHFVAMTFRSGMMMFAPDICLRREKCTRSSILARRVSIPGTEECFKLAFVSATFQRYLGV